MKKVLDECTREKHGPQAGARSASRVALVVGLAVLVLLFLEAQAVLAGIVFFDVDWSTFSGYFTWAGGFAGGTLVPYTAKNWRKIGRELSG